MSKSVDVKARQALHNYESLIQIDAALNSINTKYPFSLNDRATYTQHQITLYQSNYCHMDSEPTQEQPAVTGGAVVSVVLV
jgi:hypothetical protein